MMLKTVNMSLYQEVFILVNASLNVVKFLDSVMFLKPRVIQWLFVFINISSHLDGETEVWRSEAVLEHGH